MLKLIVLGVIPGTSIQISFELLVNAVAVIAVLFLFRTLYREHSRNTAPNNNVENEIKTYQLVNARVNQFLLRLG